MPIQRFKTLQEAERALWNFHPDEAYFRNVAELWKFANALCPFEYPRGIFKFRSIEEANKQRFEWEIDHARKVQARIISTARKQRRESEKL